jgi:hypothetical protein
MKTAHAATSIVLLLAPLSAEAQWLNYKTPGIPRTADGKPDLTASAPRTPDGKPDLSGLWRDDQSASAASDKAIGGLKAQPWAETVAKKRSEDLGRDDMGVLCQPFGPRAGSAPRKIVQTPNLIVFLDDDLTYRQIFLDGRKLEENPNPDWMGYSVGHWDGDTLVVESAGFNDRTWLNGKGYPHTEALRVTERIRRPDFGHLELQKTLVDPKALAEPLTIPLKLELDADTEMIEYVCTENEKDRHHLVGKASDDTKKEVKVAPEILSKYVGTYEFKPPERPELTVLFNMSLEDGKLMWDIDGGAKRRLIPLSETKFFLPDGGAQFEFFSDAQGGVTHLIARVVEGDFKAPRRGGGQAAKP